jgi:hypothetical protein
LPVVVVLASSKAVNHDMRTPGGRRVVVCPATYDVKVTCASCQLCAVAGRNVIVGFPAHGQKSTLIDRSLQNGNT